MRRKRAVDVLDPGLIDHIAAFQTVRVTLKKLFHNDPHVAALFG